MSGGGVEAEVKVKCDDLEALRAARPDRGWDVVVPRHFEDNLNHAD